MAISLSGIAKNKLKAPRVIIHGPPGIGKTTLAASAPSPIFIPIEDGLGSLDVDCFPQPTSFDEVLGCLAALYTEEHSFQTLVVDSLDWIEPLVWRHVCDGWTKKDGTPKRLASIEDAGYGKGYIEAATYWRQLLEGLDALRDKGMQIIMICHTQMVKVEDPSHQSYDTMTLKLHKRATGVVSEFADVILYATQHVSVTKEESGFGAKRNRALSNGERVVQADPDPTYLAKNRYGMPSPLPMDWAAIQEAMQ